MIKRVLADELTKLASKYRIVTVIGPRQAGKSTLCQLSFPEKAVVNLEDPEMRSFALSDPKGLLSQFPNGCFIDEIQQAPELLSYLQIIVDRDQLPGQFILSGSHQLTLLESISQSLAGRTAVVKLLPLAQEELLSYDQQRSLNEILVRGSYPEVVAKKLDHSRSYSFYVQTYLERDVRLLQAVKDLSTFQRFIALVAGRSGSLLNVSSLSNEVGMSESTVRNWLSVLEASFVAFRLNPYYRNLSKRQTKAPKIYFYDTGLLCYLLGIRSADQLQNHPSRGAIFETYVVSEAVKYLWNRVRESNLYFYSDPVVELDLVAETGEGLFPIEIKSTATFRPELLQQITKAQSRIELLPEGALIYAGDGTSLVNGVTTLSYKQMGELGKLIAQ